MVSSLPSPRSSSDPISEPNSSNGSPEPPTQPPTTTAFSQSSSKVTQPFDSNYSNRIVPPFSDSAAQFDPQLPSHFQTPPLLSPPSPVETPPLPLLSPFQTPSPLPTLSPFHTPTYKTPPPPPPRYHGHSLPPSRQPPSPSVSSILRYISPITYPTLLDLLLFPLFFLVTLYFINIQFVTTFCVILAGFAGVVYSCWMSYLLVKEGVKGFWDWMGEEYREDAKATAGRMDGGVFGGHRGDARKAGKVENKVSRKLDGPFIGVNVAPASAKAVWKDVSGPTTIRARSGLFGGSAKKRGVMFQ